MKRSVLVCLLLLCAAWPLAGLPLQGSTRVPPTTELYLEGQLLTPESLSTLSRFKENPLLGLIEELMRDYAGIDLEADLLSWMEGTVVAAWVREGEQSPVAEHYDYQLMNERLATARDQVEEVGNAIQRFQEQKKRLPKNLQELVKAKQLEALPSGDVELIYQAPPEPPKPKKTGKKTKPKPQNVKWTVRSRWKPNTLENFAEPPVFTSENGRVNDAKHLVKRPVHLLLAFKVKNEAATQQLLRKLKLEEVAPNRFQEVDDDIQVLAQVQQNWLVVSDRESLINRFLGNDTTNLAQNTRFGYQLQKVDAPQREESFLFFMDIQDFVTHTPAVREMVQEAEILSSVGGSYWYESPGEHHSQIFLHVNAPAEHPVGRYLRTPPTITALAPDWLSVIPWGSSRVAALELKEARQGVDAVAAAYPMAGAAAGELFTQVETSLGIKPENLASGWVVGSMETVDQYVYLGRQWMEIFKGTGEEDPAKEPGWKQFPVALVADVPDAGARQTLVTKMDEWMGNQTRTEQVGNVTMKVRQDGLLAEAQHGTRLFWANGRTVRLLRRALRASGGQEPSLLALDSLKAFRGRHPNARLVGFSHTKVDWIYALLKGLILAFGADFREEATRLGNLRDAYAALLVEPDGLRVISTLSSSQQVP